MLQSPVSLFIVVLSISVKSVHTFNLKSCRMLLCNWSEIKGVVHEHEGVTCSGINVTRCHGYVSMNDTLELYSIVYILKWVYIPLCLCMVWPYAWVRIKLHTSYQQWTHCELDLGYHTCVRVYMYI